MNTLINVIGGSRYKIDRRSLQAFATDLLNKNNLEGVTLNIIFVGKRKMRSISSTYKKEDVALPVLAFPYKDDETHEDKLLGEIFLCYSQLVLLASHRNKKIEEIVKQMVEHGLRNLINH